MALTNSQRFIAHLAFDLKEEAELILMQDEPEIHKLSQKGCQPKEILEQFILPKLSNRFTSRTGLRWRAK